MELIVISESKLKIMLTAPDMLHYELSPETIEASDVQARRAFRHLLADCGEEIGFDTQGERLLVQLYASKEGGCEIFVTKMDHTEGKEEPLQRHTYRLTEGEKALRSRIMAVDGEGLLPCCESEISTVGHGDSVTSRIRRSTCFVFEELRDVISACRRLNSIGIEGGACYIVEQSKEYLLRIDLPIGGDQRLVPAVAFLCEYGRDADARMLELFVSEHASPLIDAGAVELLATF